MVYTRLRYIPVQSIVSSGGEAKLRSANGSPSYSVSSVIQAAKWALRNTVYKTSNYLLVEIRTPNPDAFGSRFSSGTSTSSMTICPVELARSENFPSILGQLRPFIPRSRINPRILPSVFAQTIKTSATGEFVILQIKLQLM